MVCSLCCLSTHVSGSVTLTDDCSYRLRSSYLAMEPAAKMNPFRWLSDALRGFFVVTAHLCLGLRH